ncbi:MAG: OB-fold nucleic acid binding domain-containing protein, partial [Arsenophonus sp. ET-DL12-MAG3]
MNIASVIEVLQNHIIIGKKITVRGWVRTKRDSRAGFSFIAVYDGSCFNSLQIIANNKLNNYENEILSLTAGCSVEVTGIVKPSEGQEQKVELLATQVIVIGIVENPDSYPMAPKH